MKSEDNCFLAGKLWKLRECVEKQRHYSANKGLYSQGYGLPSGCIQLWELDHKEGRTPKNWCLWTVVLEKTPESPLASKEIKPVNLKGNQPWILIERTDGKAEAPVFCSPDENSQLIGKDLMLGKTEGRRRRRHQRMRWLDSITDATDINLGELQEMVRNREAYHAIVHGVAKGRAQLGDWTITLPLLKCKVWSMKRCTTLQKNYLNFLNCTGKNLGNRCSSEY